jgi:hypothetical protein
MGDMSSDSQNLGKCIEVEGVAEGPRVKAKRQLTDAQLENLKKGREKLAEKRRLQKLEKEKEESVQESVKDDAETVLDHGSDSESSEEESDQKNDVDYEASEQKEEESDYIPHGGCVVM